MKVQCDSGFLTSLTDSSVYDCSLMTDLSKLNWKSFQTLGVFEKYQAGGKLLETKRAPLMFLVAFLFPGFCTWWQRELYSESLGYNDPIIVNSVKVKKKKKTYNKIKMHAAALNVLQSIATLPLLQYMQQYLLWGKKHTHTKEKDKMKEKIKTISDVKDRLEA